MAPWQILLLGLYGVVLALVSVRLWSCLRTWRTTERLAADPPRYWEKDDYWPMVSVLVPARNEAGQIEACVRSLLAQDYPHLEVVVIDDRSTDGTSAIVERIAWTDGRLRLLRVAELPAGWIGKAHALDVGQRQARGSWLLFLDADTRHDPSCVTAIVRDALQHRAEMVTLVPALRGESFWQRVVSPAAAQCLRMLYPITRANDPGCPDAGAANGQALLVERKAYQELGGHGIARDSFTDGIRLGRAARRKGFRVRWVVGSEVLSVGGASTLPQLVSDFSRTFASAVEGQPGLLVLTATLLSVSALLPPAAIVGGAISFALGTAPMFAAGLLLCGGLHFALQLMTDARQASVVRAPAVSLLLRPLAVALLCRILGQAVQHCRWSPIVWKDTEYQPAFQRRSIPANVGGFAPEFAGDARRSA